LFYDSLNCASLHRYESGQKEVHPQEASC